MKIVVLASSYPRFRGDGVAPFVKSISEALFDRGHDVNVVAPFDVKVIPDPHAKVKVHRFKYIWPNKYHIMGHARSLQADIKLRPLVPFLLPFFIFFSTLKLWQVARKNKADVIHAHWVLPNGLSAAIVAKMIKKPLIISLHGSDIFMSEKNTVYRAVARWVFSQSSHVTACSQELFDRAKKINPEISISLLAWGADPEKFKPLKEREFIRQKYGWHEDEIIITALGRLVYKKGFHHLIAFASEFLKGGKKARLIIGGSGPIQEELKQQIKKVKLDECVELFGHVPWHEVPHFLGASDIFVLPSTRDKAGNLDGLPTVLLEAMACGLPCVASNIGGVDLVISHQNNGFLVEPEKRKNFIRYIQKLINNDSQRFCIGNQARKSVIEEYNWDNVAKRLETLNTDAMIEKIQIRLGQAYRIEYLKALGKKLDGDTVLDVGCHNIKWLEEIKAKLKICLDLDPCQPSNSISTIKASGTDLPFKPETFDVIYLLDVLEHIEDDKKLIRELVNVLKPKGQLILTTPSINIKIFPHFLTGWVSVKWGHTLRRGYDPKQLSGYFENNVDIDVLELKSKWYRFMYFPLKLIHSISPKTSHVLIKKIVNQEKENPLGKHGFILIKATKK